MNLTFKQLEALLFSVRIGSFTGAAAKLHTTQSAISKRISELEATLGVHLLHRTARGLELTPAGRRLLPLVEESNRLLQRIESEVTQPQALSGTFRVGVTELIAMTWLTPLINKLQVLHPEIVIEPMVDVGLALLDSLNQNRTDLVIMPGTFWGKQYITLPVGEVEDPWVASTSFDLPRRALKPHEFANYPVLEQAVGASKNKFYEAWRANYGFKFGRVLSTNSTTVLRELTINGYGFSQLVLDYVKPDIESGHLQIVRTEPMPPRLVYSAVFHADNSNPAIDRITELARECFDFSPRTNLKRPSTNRGNKETRGTKRKSSVK